MLVPVIYCALVACSDQKQSSNLGIRNDSKTTQSKAIPAPTPTPDALKEGFFTSEPGVITRYYWKSVNGKSTFIFEPHLARNDSLLSLAVLYAIGEIYGTADQFKSSLESLPREEGQPGLLIMRGVHRNYVILIVKDSAPPEGSGKIIGFTLWDESN